MNTTYQGNFGISELKPIETRRASYVFADALEKQETLRTK